MAAKLGNSIERALSFAGIIGWLSLAYLCSCSPPPAETGVAGADASAQFDETNPLGANAACYVCHIPFVSEELSKTHLRAEITCIDCHGLSAAHANDENIGATPPDITFDRDEIDTMCFKCHKRHDILAEEAAVSKHPPVCTDCHGTHRISEPASRKPAKLNAMPLRDSFRQLVVGTNRSVTCWRYKDEVMASRL